MSDISVVSLGGGGGAPTGAAGGSLGGTYPNPTVPALTGPAFVNVKDPAYGAVGDGVADDSTAIQAAINALNVNRGGTVYFPQGIYYIATGLTATNSGTTLIGEGQTGVSDELAKGSTQIVVGNGVWGLTLGSSSSSENRGYRLENLNFYEKNAGQASGGVRVFRSSDNTFENVSVGRFTGASAVGFLVDGTGGQSQYNVFINCRFGNCTTGYQQKAANGTRMIGCYWEGSNNGGAPTASSVGALVTSGDTFKAIGCIFQGFDTLLDLSANIGHETSACRFEVFTTQAIILRGGAGAQGARIFGTIDNSIRSSVGTGVVLSSGVIDPTIDMHIVSVATTVTDSGATRPTVRVKNASLVSFASNFLAADVTMTTAGTFYDGASLTLAPGTWLLIGSLKVLAATTAVRTLKIKLWDGTTAITDSQFAVTGTGAAALVTQSVAGIVSPTASTTYKVSGTSTVNADIIKAGAADLGTYLYAVKIA